MKNKLAKSIAISLLSFSFAAIGAIANLGVGAKEEVKAVQAADEYTTYTTNITAARVHYSSWLVFTFDNMAGQTNTDTPAFSFADFNTRDKIYYNGDPTLKAIGTSMNVIGFGIDSSASTSFLEAAASIKSAGWANLASITIPAGTEFPSRATVAGTEKVKYVTAQDVTFYYLNHDLCTTDKFTHEDHVKFVDTEVVEFSTQKPNPGWPAFKLSVNDYDTQVNQSVFSKSQMFKFLAANNKVKNAADDGKVYDVFVPAQTAAYTNFDSNCTDCFSIVAPQTRWGSYYTAYKVVFIPKGTIFPSYNWVSNFNDVTKDKTLYRTTKDVLFYCDNQYGSSFKRVEPEIVANDVSVVGGVASFEQASKPYINFTWSMVENNKGQSAANLQMHWGLSYFFDSLEFYNGETLLSPADVSTSIVNYSYGAQFANFGGNDYLVQVQTGAVSTADKIIVKKGALMPSIGAAAGTSNVWYQLQEDQEFVAFSGVFGSRKIVESFIKDYMHTEVAGNVVGEGKCVTESWYTTAKSAFAGLGYNNIVILANVVPYNGYFIRLCQWAAANGEAFDNATTTFKANNVGTLNVTSESSETLIILIASITSIVTVAALLMLKKNRKRDF